MLVKPSHPRQIFVTHKEPEVKMLSNPVFQPTEELPITCRIRLEPCIECGKPIEDGYYGRYGDGGVCSKACDILHMKEKKQ